MYYIVDVKTGETLKESETPFNVDENVQPPFPLAQLKGVEPEPPQFNKMTQKLNKVFEDNFSNFTRVFSYETETLPDELIAKHRNTVNKRNEKNTLINTFKLSNLSVEKRLERLEDLMVKLLKGDL